DTDPASGNSSLYSHPNSGDSKSWKTTVGGAYTISLDTVALSVTFTSTPLTIGISGGAQGLAPGENATFTATGNATEIGATVTWSVTGGNSGSNSTTVSGGTLTLDSAEWITHTLTVKAEVLGEEATAQVAVIDPKVYLVGFMNSWNPVGLEMTRGSSDAIKHLFTWTGSLSSERDFRMHRDNSDTDTNNWSRLWFAPNGTTEDTNNRVYGIHSGHHEDMLVDRWGDGGSGTDRKWQITSWGEGDGTYTITFNAAAKTLTVTRNNDAQ
ncbi:MAG: hypothetical protein LBE74_04170, partial [Treponema sp.]|nr:hypothetical protein [Treponema sp.]